VEGFAEGFAFAEDGEPGEAGLESVEHESFPKRTAIALRNTPFLVVIVAQEGVVFCP
jgi:hypothetical protein